MTARPLAGKAAVVTGASRGLGRTIAVALASAGALVAVAARSVPDLEETARLIADAGGRGLVVPTDVAVYADGEALMDGVVRDLGHLDIVVNNSGIAKVAPLAEMSPDDWRQVIDVNLTGVFHGCRAAARHLFAQGGGKVINLASVLGAVGLAGYTAYGASKGRDCPHADARRRVGPSNVQVNAIAPGWFVTDRTTPRSPSGESASVCCVTSPPGAPAGWTRSGRSPSIWPRRPRTS